MTVLSEQDWPPSTSSLRSREETRFLLLLSRTEERVSREVAPVGRIPDPKIVFFVKQLATMLEELEKHPQSPSKDSLREYRSKVEFLNRVVEEARDVSPDERASADAFAELRDVPLLYDAIKCRNEEHSRLIREGVRGMTSATALTSSPSRTLSSWPSTSSSQAAALVRPFDKTGLEIKQKLTARQKQSERAELLGHSDMELRHRPSANVSSNSDLDALLKAHHAAQEQVAEEMLSLTRALKEQSLAARDIIRKDTAVIEQTSDLADRNTTKLATESERLSKHTGFSCRCWIWFLMLVVAMTFIAMVLVMKIFRKRFVTSSVEAEGQV